MLRLRSSVAALSCSLLASCAATPSEQSRSVDVKAGISAKVGSGSQWNSSCQMIQIPVLTIIDPPKNGTTEIKRSTNRIGGGTVIGSNPCVGQEIEGIGLFYQSTPGYHGTDHLKYTVYLQGSSGLPGNTLTTNLDITVK